jgi:hypothetical protein
VPGLPFETLPDLQPILACGSFFQSADDSVVSNFLRPDGVFVFSSRYRSQSVPQIEPTDSNQNLELLIKWKGLPISDTTWETQKSLLGSNDEPFVIANIAEFELIKSLYLTEISQSVITGHRVGISRVHQIGLVGRNIELTADQKLIPERPVNSESDR